MPTITSAGIGSGLDINSIISQLMALERRPLNLLDRKEAIVQSQISSYGKLKSNLADFQSKMSALSDLDKFKVFTATSSNEAVFTASADSTASLGTYQVQVDQLASAHKITSTGFADATTAIGSTGTIRINSGAVTFDVVIDSTNNTLQGLRDAINGAAGNNNSISAGIIQVDDGSGGKESRLVLNANESGTANSITLSDISGSVGATLAFTHTTLATDALVTIDGFGVTSSSNSVTGAVQGITLNLSQAQVGVAHTLTLERDTAAVTESIQAFADAFNELKSSLKAFRTGELQGDSILLGIENQLQSVLNTAPTSAFGPFSYLSEIGLSIQKDGLMQLDTARLDSVLGSNFADVANLFANDSQGYAFRLDAMTDGMLQFGGIIDARTDGLEDRIDGILDRKTTIERRLETVENRLRSQFSALDTLLGELQNTSSFMTQQLANLNSLNQRQ